MTLRRESSSQRRGLPNLKNTVDALPVIVRKDSLELFTKYKVYSERELQSRYNIFAEKYVKEVSIEAATMINIAKTLILPAALRYQGEVATAVNATKAAGVDAGAQFDHLKGLTKAITDFQTATKELDTATHHKHSGEPYTDAKAVRDTVVPKMVELRALGDALETIVADDLWPLPTYREMLFIK